MLIYQVYQLVNDELKEGNLYLNLCDAKANCELVNDREERRFQKTKLSWQLKGKKYEKLNPDRWKVRELEVLE